MYKGTATCREYSPACSTMLPLHLELQYALNLLSPRQDFLLLLSCESLYMHHNVTLQHHDCTKNSLKTRLTYEVKQKFKVKELFKLSFDKTTICLISLLVILKQEQCHHKCIRETHMLTTSHTTNWFNRTRVNT